jgi:catechol-2,3-dioxygenase
VIPVGPSQPARGKRLTNREVLGFQERLTAAGVPTKGLVDHEFIASVYFFDPNGLRVEITVRTEAP